MRRIPIRELKDRANTHRNKYENALMRYRKEVTSLIEKFCEKHNFEFDESSIFWEYDEGDFNERTYPFSAIEYDVVKGIEVGEIERWNIYNDSIRASYLGDGLSFEEYVDGYRPFTQEEIDKALEEIDKGVYEVFKELVLSVK